MMLTKDNFEKLDRWQIDTALATWRAMSNSMSTTHKRGGANDSLNARDVACLVACHSCIIVSSHYYNGSHVRTT
jgi:predicted metal-binding protein